MTSLVSRATSLQGPFLPFHHLINSLLPPPHTLSPQHPLQAREGRGVGGGEDLSYLPRQTQAVLREVLKGLGQALLLNKQGSGIHRLWHCHRSCEERGNKNCPPSHPHFLPNTCLKNVKAMKASHKLNKLINIQQTSTPRINKN